MSLSSTQQIEKFLCTTCDCWNLSNLFRCPTRPRESPKPLVQTTNICSWGAGVRLSATVAIFTSDVVLVQTWMHQLITTAYCIDHGSVLSLANGQARCTTFVVADHHISGCFVRPCNASSRDSLTSYNRCSQ